ncbi:hypothetical protein B484DRAFT_390414, partial [Ochromonadaceae sp. CCMP2298]
AEAFLSPSTLPRRLAALSTLRAAVLRRTRYDALVGEDERRRSAQARRLRIEQESSLSLGEASLRRQMEGGAVKPEVKTEGGVEGGGLKGGGLKGGGVKGRAKASAPASASAFSASAVVAAEAEEAEEGWGDFDLEDLVGGALATVQSSR